MADKDEIVATWGYSKKDAQIFYLKPGESLPAGYYDHAAKVPGSAANKQYIADAESEGASLDFITSKKPETADGK